MRVLGKNVVGNSSDRIILSEILTKLQHQGSFSRTDRPNSNAVRISC